MCNGDRGSALGGGCLRPPLTQPPSRGQRGSRGSVAWRLGRRGRWVRSLSQQQDLCCAKALEALPEDLPGGGASLGLARRGHCHLQRPEELPTGSQQDPWSACE